MILTLSQKQELELVSPHALLNRRRGFFIFISPSASTCLEARIFCIKEKGLRQATEILFLFCYNQ